MKNRATRLLLISVHAIAFFTMSGCVIILSNAPYPGQFEVTTPNTKVQSQGSRLNVTVNTEIGTRCTGEFQLRIIQNGEYDIFLIFTHTKANALVYFGKWDIDNSPDCQEYLSPSTKGEHGFYLLSWSHGEVFQHDRGNYWTMSSVYCTQDQNESESCRFKYFGSFEMNNSNDL